MKNLSSKSAWNARQIQRFLEATRIPVRIAVMDGDYPLICSVWYEYREGNLCVVSHKDSKLAHLLKQVGRCAFEIAPNEPPYHGVRGKADVTASDDNAEPFLNRLIERYLGDSNERLSNWLLGRADDEIVFTLHATWATSWDYGGRMVHTDG